MNPRDKHIYEASIRSIGMDIALEVLTAEGRTEREFSNVESIEIAAAPGTDGLELTLIGERDSEPNQVETGILDVAPRHEELLSSPVPRTDSGESIPVARRDDCSSSDSLEMLNDSV